MYMASRIGVTSIGSMAAGICIVIITFFIQRCGSVGCENEDGPFVFKHVSNAAEILNMCLSLRSELAGDGNIMLNEGFLSYTHELTSHLHGSSLGTAKAFYMSADWSTRISHQLITCAWRLKQNTSIVSTELEYLYHASLALWPDNSVTAKNYAFLLEIRACSELSSSLLEQSWNLHHDAGVILQHAFTSTTYLAAEREGRRLFHRMVTRALDILQKPVQASYRRHPFYEIRALQTSHQYFGISPGIISDLYARVLIHQFPQFDQASYLLPSVDSRVDTNIKRSFIVGIVSEFAENSSPALCLEVTLLKYARSTMLHTTICRLSYQGC
jgi:hypothetical protein